MLIFPVAAVSIPILHTQTGCGFLLETMQITNGALTIGDTDNAFRAMKSVLF